MHNANRLQACRRLVVTGSGTPSINVSSPGLDDKKYTKVESHLSRKLPSSYNAKEKYPALVETQNEGQDHSKAQLGVA